MSNADYTKYYLEINGKRMYIDNPKFDWDVNNEMSAHWEPDIVKSPAKLAPTVDPLNNPLHKILKANFDELDAAYLMKIKKHPKQVTLPFCSIGVERSRNGKETSYIKYKFFQVQAVQMYKDRPFYKHYVLGFQHFTRFDSGMNVVEAG